MTDTTLNNGTADLKLLKAGVDRIEKDVERLDRKFDTYLTQHQATHAADQTQMNQHLLLSAESMNRSLRHEQDIPGIEHRIEIIETWRHELLGAMSLVKIAFGTSIISSIVAIVSLVTLFTK